MGHLGETPDQTVNNLQALAGLRSALQANAEAMNRLDEERILLTSLPEPTRSVLIPTSVLRNVGAWNWKSANSK